MKIKLLPLIILAFSCSEKQSEEKTKVVNPNIKNQTEEVNQGLEKPTTPKSYCMVNSLNVRPTSGIKGKVIYQLGLSEEVELTGNVSEETFKANFRGTDYDKPWVEVKTASGISGWVHSGALVDQPIEIDQKLTAEYYNTSERRKEWWSGLQKNWQRIFNIMVLRKNEYHKPTDDEIQKLFNETSMTLGPDEGCGNYAYEFDVKDLSGVRCLSRLESLGISTIEISNLEEISHMTNLTHLDASACKLKSLAGIGSLKNLDHLNVSYNQIPSLKQLIGHTNLITLWAESNEITDLEGIQNSGKLNSLYIADNKISNYEQLAQLDSLRSLNLDGPNTKTLNFTTYLVKLKKFNSLSLRYCSEIVDITPLKRLKNLESIDLGAIRVDDLSPIEHVKTLIKIFEYNNEDPHIPRQEIERIKKLGITVHEQEEICGC